MSDAPFLMMPPAANTSAVYLGQPAQAQSRRTYAASAGAIVPVPIADDAIQLQNRGWIIMPGSGSTAQRPTSLGGSLLPVPTYFIDTTISKTIVWDGATWRSATDGSAV